MNETSAKPLGKITAILADLGLEVTYAYDDLVFVQHSAFLLQFTGQPNSLTLFTNTECDPKEAAIVVEEIVSSHAASGYFITPSGQFAMTSNEDETIRLEFI